VQACIDKAGNAFDAVSQCGKAYPEVSTNGMANTASTVGGGKGDGSNSGAGLYILGGLAAVVAVGWAKKKFARL
jgi:hypothetical protein